MFFHSLYAKTFAILGSQLFITWAVTVLVIRKVRNLYYAKARGISGSTTEDGLLDLELDRDVIMPYFWVLLVIDVIVFLLLLFKGQDNLLIGLPLFSIWSILTGIGLAIVLISVDENLGCRILAMTVTITVGCAIAGIYSGVDFSFLSDILFFALCLLVIGNMLRLFLAIPRNKQRVLALFGVLVFTGYLLYDFNRLAKLDETAGANTWEVAMSVSIDIYLDIINLFLELLDAMSE